MSRKTTLNRAQQVLQKVTEMEDEKIIPKDVTHPKSGDGDVDVWKQGSKMIADHLMKEFGNKDKGVSAVNSYISSNSGSLDDQDLGRLNDVIDLLNNYFDVNPNV